MLFVNTVSDIRDTFAALYQEQNFVIDKTGSKVLEIIGTCFNADQESIFGKVNEDYVQRELDWYLSQSLYVNDIPGGPPAIWKQVACRNGRINSNYGWAIFSDANGSQYDHVVEELVKNPFSRRATMIYTRPNMWNDYNENGRSDFMCTNAVQYLIRDGAIHAVVQMRSNDAVFGYKNDRFWQLYVLTALIDCIAKRTSIKYKIGDIHWCVGSLHVYERHFKLVEDYIEATTK